MPALVETRCDSICELSAMSTSLVHAFTVIGKGAGEVEAACEELLGRRVVREPNAYGSEDWSEADHKAIEGLCTSLINAARELPVVYYAQYLDSWSVANSPFSLLKWPDGRRRYICGDSHGLVFYPSEFYRDLLEQIKRFRRRRFYRDQAEDRWFLQQMREALDCGLWLETPSLVVSINEPLGPSEVEEIEAAVNLSIGPLNLTRSAAKERTHQAVRRGCERR